MQILQHDKTCPKCKRQKLKIIDKENWYEEKCQYCGFGIGKPQSKKGEMKEFVKEKMKIEEKRFRERIRPTIPKIEKI